MHHLPRPKRSPGDPQNSFFFGRAFRLRGHYVAAEKAFLACLEVFPDDRGTWKELGKLRFFDGEFEKALEAFQRALRIDPEALDVSLRTGARKTRHPAPRFRKHRERTQIEGFTDTLVWSSSAVASLASGLILAAAGFSALGIIAAVLLVVPVYAVLRLRRQGG